MEDKIEKVSREILDRSFQLNLVIGDQKKKTLRKTPKKRSKKATAHQEMFTDPKNENPEVEFPLLTPVTRKHVDLHKEMIFSFDIFELGDEQYLIASIADNSYYLHCLDTKKNHMDLIKQENIQLVVKAPKTNYNEQDSFYTIRFAEFYPDEENDDFQLMLIFAGKSGIIFLANIENDFTLTYLLGHVNEVYEICCTPKVRREPEWKNLLFSCSKDTSVNLWNIKKRVQIACFREISQVPADSISIDCHYSMNTFAVSHFDGCIKIWSIDNKVVEKIKEARYWNKDPLLFKHLDVRKPFSLTRDLHSNTCDFVQYYGDFVVSKDSEGIICVSSITKLGAQIIYEMAYPYYEPIWFVKCGLDLKRKLLFVGNDNGEIFFWKFNQNKTEEFGKINLPVKKQVRKVALISDGKYVILTTDNGHLYYLQFKNAF